MSEQLPLDVLNIRVKRYVARRVRDRHLAEDLAQEVMLRVHAHRSELPDESQGRLAWALRVARNLVVDYYRSAESRLQPLTAEHPARPEADRSPVSSMANCVSRMLRHLPTQYRRAVERADVHGVPQHLVARELGLTLSGAKSRVQRGRAQLAALVSRCCRIERDAAGRVEGFAATTRSQEFCGLHTESCVL